MAKKHPGTDMNCPQEGPIAGILTSIEFIRSDRESFKQLIDGRLSGIHAENMSQYDLLMERMAANHNIEMEQLKAIVARQDVANGRTSKNELQMKEIELQIETIRNEGRKLIQHQRFARWVSRNPLLSAGLGLVLLFLMIVVASYLDAQFALGLMK